MILDPRRHDTHRRAPDGCLPDGRLPSAATEPLRRALTESRPSGCVVEANAGGSVLLMPGATRAQLLELRGVIDAALARSAAR